MPNIEDLMKQYAKEIAGEKEQFQDAIQTRVSRESIRRPWDFVAEPQKAQASSSDSVTPSTPFAKRPVPIWYSSWETIKGAVGRNKFGVQVSFYITLVITCFFAQFITSTYSSTLHLYAPEKPNDIASRLPMFSNRVEFASFPVNLKIPLGLIARRLRGEPAKAWVMAQYASRPKKVNVPIDPSIMRAETFYAEGSELLVVQGYANDPQIAADVTNLYWDYLENEIQTINKEHNSHVTEWLDLTAQGLKAKIEDVSSQIAQSAVAPLSDTMAKVDAKLADSLSDVELRKLKIQKELDELKRANNAQSLDRLWAISMPEIQDLRAVDRALQDESGSAPVADTLARRADIQSQAFKLSKQLGDDKARELNELEMQAHRMKVQLDQHLQSSGSRQVSEVQKELFQNETVYRAQLEEVGRLASQLKVEAALNATRLRVIQPALSDPTSRRPMLVLVYTVCALLAFLASILYLMFVEMRLAAGARALKRKEALAQDTRPMPSPFSEPHAPGLGV